MNEATTLRAMTKVDIKSNKVLQELQYLDTGSEASGLLGKTETHLEENAVSFLAFLLQIL